jgi:hypothetical protein
MPMTCSPGAAANFVNDAVPCPSDTTCVADKLGRKWTPPVRIDDGTGCATRSVQAVLAPGGSRATVIAWADSSPTRVRVRRLDGTGGSWSAAVEDARAGWGATLRLAVSRTGDAMLASSDGQHVRASASVQGGAWSALADVSGARSTEGAAELAMDKNGAAMAVWMQTASRFGQATWGSATGWSAPDVDTGDKYAVSVTAHPDGGFAIGGLIPGAVFYRGYLGTPGTFVSEVAHLTSADAAASAQGTTSVVVPATREPCVVWIVPDSTAFPGTFNYDCHIVTQAGYGLWDNARLGDNKVEIGTRPLFAKSADGNTLLFAWNRSLFFPPRGAAWAVQDGVAGDPISFGGYATPNINAMAMDDAGNAVVAWGGADAPDTVPVHAVRFFASGGWEQVQQPLFVSATPVVLVSLAVSMSPAGQALVAYVLRTPGGADRVYAQLLK